MFSILCSFTLFFQNFAVAFAARQPSSFKSFCQLSVFATLQLNLFLEMKQYSIIEVMHHIKGNKVTLKTEDVLLQLMSQFFKIKENLYHLINQQPHNHLHSKQIFAICRALPKSFERNKNRYNQLQLCQELCQLVDYFLANQAKVKRRQMKEGPKRKSYEVLLAWKQFAEILTNRIRASLSGNLQEMANHKEHFKLFYLINQLEFLSKEIQNWAKRQEKTPRKKRNQSVEFIFPESATNRKTLATTAIDSRNASKYQKSETIEEFNNKVNEYCLLRANTAKLERKPAKMSVRCPSAASLLKHETYKQPLFESKKPILKYKRKSSADFEQKSHRNFELSDNNLCFDTNPNSRMRQIKLTASKERKVSILNKSQKEDDDGIRIKSKKYLIDNQKLRKSGIGKLNKRRKEVKPNVVSNEEIASSKDMESDEKLEQSQCQILDPEEIVQIRQSFPTNTSIKKESKIFSKKRVESQSEKSLLSSAYWESQENTLYIKSRHLYKKVRRSGKISIRKSQEIINSSIGNPQLKESKFNKRRKAIRSSHNMEMTQIQNLVNEEQEQKEKKQLQFNQNVLLAISDALKSRTNLMSKMQLQKDTEINEKKSMNQLFQEMNTFLKDYFIGKPAQASDSVFFQQQKRLRKCQDHNFREKMKELVLTNGNANIFEISSTQVNNKDQIYNQIHRYLTFNSDSDWIKHMHMPKQHLSQKSF